VRGGTLNGECKGGKIWSIYLVYLYKNRKMNSVEIVLKKGEGYVGELWKR
jgi:hypothetical protein